MGGSSAINSMIAIRGNPGDYADAGRRRARWNGEKPSPYLRKIETPAELRPSTIKTEAILVPSACLTAPCNIQMPVSLKAPSQPACPRTTGFNGPSQIGAGFTNHHRGWQTPGASVSRSRKGAEQSDYHGQLPGSEAGVGGYARVRGVVIEKGGREVIIPRSARYC